MNRTDWLEASAMFSIFAMLLACGLAFFLPHTAGAKVVIAGCIPGALTSLALHFHKWTGETL